MKQAGLTIIQLMFILLILGLIGSFAVDYLIELRCESNVSSDLCKGQSAGATPARL